MERALARAREVDEHLQRTGQVIGPLHGLPISLKDQFCMKGLETIMGQSDPPNTCISPARLPFMPLCQVTPPG